MVDYEHPQNIDQALAESLKGQLYHAPVSKCFLASAVVYGFGVCRWIRMWNSLWRACSSVSAPLYDPAFPLDKNNSVLIFLRRLC